jgi:hypothetical protein
MTDFQDKTITWPEVLFLNSGVPLLITLLAAGLFMSYDILHKLVKQEKIRQTIIPSWWFWFIGWTAYLVLFTFASFLSRWAFGPSTSLTGGVLAWYIVSLVHCVLLFAWLLAFFAGLNEWTGVAVFLSLSTLATAATLLVVAFVKTDDVAGYLLIPHVIIHVYLFIVTLMAWIDLKGKTINVQYQKRIIETVGVSGAYGVSKP